MRKRNPSVPRTQGSFRPSGRRGVEGLDSLGLSRHLCLSQLSPLPRRTPVLYRSFLNASLSPDGQVGDCRPGVRMFARCLDCSGCQRFAAATYKRPVGLPCMSCLSRHIVGTCTPYWDLRGCLPRISSAGLDHSCAPAKGPGPGCAHHPSIYHRKLSTLGLGC